MPMNGIDISSHQTGINLAAVPADFVIVKTTQGNWYVNPDADRAYQQAKRAGRLLGVYHYIDGSGGAQAEADYFIDQCRGYLGEALLAVDWEVDDNRVWGDLAYLEQVVRRIIARTGVKPLIYTMQNSYTAVKPVADRLDCGLWVAQYADNNPTGYQAHPWNEGAYGCAIRQYASTGRLPGYGDNLDLNLAYFDRDAWKRYANPNHKVPNRKPAANTAATINKEIQMGTTHIIFKLANSQACYIANILAGTYQLMPNMDVLNTRKYVLEKAGAKVRTWREVNGNKGPDGFGEVGKKDLAAFGVEIK